MVKTASIAPYVPREDSSLATRLDNSLDTLWVSLQAVPGRPLNFSPELLSGFERLLDRIEGNDWHWQEDSREGRLRSLVLSSSHPRHFALGGDLAYFQSCIESGNAGALRAYSMRCLDLVRRIFSAAHEVTTVTLVQGRALGGGFETALSATHLIAERGAEFGFPEIAFGTFPCTGAIHVGSAPAYFSISSASVRSSLVYCAPTSVSEHTRAGQRSSVGTRMAGRLARRSKPARHATARR